MFTGTGNAIDIFIKTGMCLSVLGLWKVIEIIYWLIVNVEIGLK